MKIAKNRKWIELVKYTNTILSRICIYLVCVPYFCRMKNITIKELESWKEEGKNFQLIDVREEDEHEIFNIGGELIPLNLFIKSPEKVDLFMPVVVYCKRGIRSQLAIQRLSIKVPQADFYNLQDGVYPLFSIPK